jgi:hypothetical protein
MATEHSKRGNCLYSYKISKKIDILTLYLLLRVKIMEIREIKKSKPQTPVPETTPPAPTATTPTIVAPNVGKKPRKLTEEEKQQRLSEESKPDKPDKPDKFQHIKIIDCNQPVTRVICECWHCLQGLLIEVEALPAEYLETPCPNCGKCAIRLQASKVISTTPIPSPWS